MSAGDLNSRPAACTINILTHGSISPVPRAQLFYERQKQAQHQKGRSRLLFLDLCLAMNERVPS